MMLGYSIWMGVIGWLYYAAEGAYNHEANYLLAWLLSACSLLMFLATKPRKKK